MQLTSKLERKCRNVKSRNDDVLHKSMRFQNFNWMYDPIFISKESK